MSLFSKRSWSYFVIFIVNLDGDARIDVEGSLNIDPDLVVNREGHDYSSSDTTTKDDLLNNNGEVLSYEANEVRNVNLYRLLD